MAKKDKIVYTDYIEPIVFRDRAIDINTKRGKRAATKMAHRIAKGKERIENVPASYRNYVNGVLYGSMPTTKAIDNAGKKFAPVLAGAAVAPWLISGGIAAYTNPVTKAIIDGIGAVDGIRNAASKNGIRKTVRLAKEKDYWGAAKSGIGDVLDIAGGVGFVDDAYRYTKGAGKRLAEAVVRIGDSADSSMFIKDQLFNKNALNYILNPYADPKLAYNLPYKYSGEAAGTTGAHYGDVVDQYFRKVPVRSNFDSSEIHPELAEYIRKNYKGRNVAYVDLGEVMDIRPYGSFGDLADGERIYSNATSSGLGRGSVFNYKEVLDPGGYNAFSVRQGDDLKHIGYDIWKFNPNDYMSRYNPRAYNLFPKHPKLNMAINKSKLTRVIPKMGLKFIDRMGDPIVYKFTKTTPGYYHSGIDDALVKSGIDKLNVDEVLGYIPSQETINMIKKANEPVDYTKLMPVFPPKFNK